MSAKTKQMLIILGVVVAIVVVYSVFFTGQDSADQALVAQQSAAPQVLDGPLILALLSKLNRVTLDETIFSNKIYASLVNFEKPIEDQAIGRPNPFLPIGLTGTEAPLSKSTSTFKTIPKSR